MDQPLILQSRNPDFTNKRIKQICQTAWGGSGLHDGLCDIA